MFQLLCDKFSINDFSVKLEKKKKLNLLPWPGPQNFDHILTPSFKYTVYTVVIFTS